MKVKANRVGFYGLKRQYPGDEFMLKDEKDFSKKWMEKCDEPEAKKSEPKEQPKPKPKGKGKGKKVI